MTFDFFFWNVQEWFSFFTGRHRIGILNLPGRLRSSYPADTPCNTVWQKFKSNPECDYNRASLKSNWCSGGHQMEFPIQVQGCR